MMLFVAVLLILSVDQASSYESDHSETYRYFDLPYCLPDNAKEKRLALGEMLNGDRLVSAPYPIEFLRGRHSESVCKKKLSKEDVAKFRAAVNTHFEKRMDKYSQSSLLPHHLEIHRHSVIGSCMTVLLLAGFLAAILRILNNDFVKNPKYKSLFAACLGSGTQLLTLTMFIFILAPVGVFYPYNRRALLTASVVIYALTSGIAGYTAISFYCQLEGTNWVFAHELSHAALPLGTTVVIVLIWTLLSSPLLVLGGIVGKNSKAEFQAPCRTTEYPREIPPLRWHLTGFIMVVLTHFQLASEDHKWCWRSFLCGGSTGIFMYAYCVYYYYARTDMSGFMQTSFFFGYMACICLGVFLMLGTVAMATAIATPSALSPLHRSLPSFISATPNLSISLRSSIRRKNVVSLVRCSHAAISPKSQGGAFDPELRSVLELATDSELYELEKILFGPSYFSPLLKSIASKKAEIDYAMIDHDLEEREDFLSSLESRFLFLAADARSTLRGWRPTYRNVLLTVRKKLNIRCSSKLSTEDLEAEIFLHLIEEYASEQSGTFPGLWELSKTSDDQGSLGIGLSQEKVQALAAQKLGAADLHEEINGEGVSRSCKLSNEKGNCQEVKHLLCKGPARQVNALMSSKKYMIALAQALCFAQAWLLWCLGSYQASSETYVVFNEGGQLAAINLESRVALLAAKQGFVGTASRYLGLRSMMSLLGPMLWGTFLADVVIQMLGTDYARILRAIYAFAQLSNFLCISNGPDKVGK
ncbi:unnamed protein product [Dovyalis caffra]|uniref:Transmembrane 9 superfamily member n=1 Tax=Dovyalis caffra TaxID=77055 RepID=A0AAV1QWB0_9ROSI|nr:unnamed protein product [Dovyalis caffra]